MSFKEKINVKTVRENSKLWNVEKVAFLTRTLEQNMGHPETQFQRGLKMKESIFCIVTIYE